MRAYVSSEWTTGTYAPQTTNPDLQALAHYISGPFASGAALTEREFGSGRAPYLGCYPNDSQAKTLLSYLAAQVNITSQVAFPDGLIASRRGTHITSLNFTDGLLTATVQGEPVSVGPRDVVVVKTNKT